MPTEIIVPPLSQTMDTVVLVEWLKAVGEQVARGEPLFVIETDKANLDVEAPASGILQQVLAQAGDEVRVRSSIGLIAAPGEATAAEAVAQTFDARRPQTAEAATSAAAQPTLVVATGPEGEPLPPERRNRVFASPRARRLAEEEGVPLKEVHASGPQQMIVERDVRSYLVARPTAPAVTPVARRVAEAVGIDLAAVEPSHLGTRITRADVEAALEKREPAPVAGIQWVEMPSIRRTIARRMLESQQGAAEVTLMRDVDATELVDLRKHILEELADGDPRPTYTDLLVSILARALRKHTHANAIIDGDRIGLSEGVHIAIAVDTERGLLTPVIRDADQKGLLALAAERRALVERTLDGSISLDELTGGTFTITNLGTLGVDAFTPIINPPQSAILGVGRIRTAPGVHEGQLCIRQLMFLSLTFDHRVIDGAPAARFLNDVVRMIEKPHLIWL